MISPDIIVLYDGANSSIPDGFVRDTRFDGRLPLAAITELASTGGSLTHEHTGTNSHVMNSHAHTADTQTSQYDAPSGNSASTGGSGVGSHRHSVNMASATFSSSGPLEGNVTYAAASHLPLSYQFIFLRSTGYNLLPSQGCVLSARSQSDLSFHTASAGKYIMGAPANTSAGGTTGSSTHSHDVSHTHNAMTHTHTVTTGGASGDLANSRSGNTPAWHTHTFTVSQELTGDTYEGECPEYVNEPTYAGLNVYKNVTDTPVPIKAGTIAMYLGETLPLGWVDCDGSNGTPNLPGFFVKNNQQATSTVTTGGANTHSHTASNSHTHTQSHNHGGSATSSWSGTSQDSAGQYTEADNHRHTISNISTTNATWALATISSDSAENIPPFIKVRFIMATNKGLGSAATVYQNFM